MTRLPKYAERFFAAQVSDFDALCHRVEEDETGWDYLVEFPADPFDGPADQQPAPKRAFVQIKSRQSRPLKVGFSLSNLRRAAQDATPWFFSLIRKEGGKPEIYIIHFWRELIERSLIAVRRAEMDGEELHKRELQITFGKGDRVEGDFVKWMRDQIAGVPEYEKTKRHLFETLGLESGHGKGRLVIQGDPDQIYREFLGVGQGLTISRFEYTPERFNIPDPSRAVVWTGGKVKITPQALGPCELRFRSPNSEPSVTLSGSLFGLPFQTPEAPFRVAAPPVDLRGSSSGLDMYMSVQNGNAMTYEEWRVYATLKMWSRKAPLQIELWREGRHYAANTLIDRKPGDNLDWERIDGIMRALRPIVIERKVHDFAFTVEDMNRTASDLWFFSVGAAPSLRYEFDAESDVEPDVTSMLYYQVADLNDWTFGHIVRRRIRSDQVEGTKRHIDSHTHTVLESYAFKNATQEQKDRIASDYDGLLRKYEEQETHPLGFGDFTSFVRRLLENPSSDDEA